MKILTLAVMLGISVTAATALAAEAKSDDAKGEANTEAKADAAPEAKDEAAPAEVKGDAAAGAGKIAVCVACHGEGGAVPAAPIYPKLAGQTTEYLTSSMQAYRDGLRLGGMAAMMSPQAATLSDQDIADIAAYYSQQNPSGEPQAQAPAK